MQNNNCVYKITNLINGKFYIGSTNNFNRRMKEHRVFVNCSPDRNGYDYPLYRAFRKYGLKNFSFQILYQNIPTLKEAREIQHEQIVKQHALVPNNYNLKQNTIGLSEEDIKRIIEKTGTKCALVNDKEQILKTYNSLRQAERDTHCSASSIGNVCKGYKYNTNGLFFRFLNEAQEIVEIDPKYPLRYVGYCGIQLADPNHIVYFKTQKQAAIFCGVSEISIQKSVCGKTKYSGGYIWRRYANGEIIENDNIKIEDVIQNYNKTHIEYKGEKKTLGEWANSIGLSSNGLKYRLKTMSFQEAMKLPVEPNPRRGTGKRKTGR